MNNNVASLSADRPSTDPSNDIFGHAPFAKTLANAIRAYRGEDGIVLALYGPWGSGKSTVLAYVEHELALGEERDRPVVVPFNPWWFSGQELLAKAFLGQLQAVLPAKHAGFKTVGNKLAEFSSALGGAADLAGAVWGIPLGSKVIEAGAKLMATKPKDVPALKKALSQLLIEQKKRILVLIDDIDRLAPDEVRQLFTVIKALGDFPYVTYLLAFDHEVAATAISEQTGLPGARYLEKIVQVPFELPRVDRTTLHQALFVRLDAVMAGTPERRFDSAYWTNVFHTGLDPLFTVPRDIVRLTNALSVTYPAIVGEVNPVDFIAIECLRVFLPSVYDTIRTSPEKFTGYRAPNGEQERQHERAFHDAWVAKLPDTLRTPAQELLQILFPRLDSVWSNMHYSRESLQEWRRGLRVCSPDVFPTYFRLSLPAGAVSRADLDSLLSLVADENAFAEAFRSAAEQKSATGTSKARALLERLMDHVPTDLSSDHAQPVIYALLSMGDDLLLPTDVVPGAFDSGNESRIARIAYHLLKKVEPASRAQLLSESIERGNAIRCSQYLLASLDEQAAKGEGETLVTSEEVEQLKGTWRERLLQLSASEQFINHPSLAVLLSAWRRWGGEDEAKSWWQTQSSDDENLPKLIAAFVSETRTQTFGEYAVRVQLRVNPKAIQYYGDVQTMASRLKQLLDSDKVDEKYRPSASQFVFECKLMKEGIDPDAFEFEND